MKYYLDSSALVKLYVPEKESAVLSRNVSGCPLPFTQFHELEVKNALQLKRFRDPSLSHIAQATCDLIDQDVEARILYRPDLSWTAVFRLAIELALLHTANIGCRSLDILHVAAAKAGEFEQFITYDERQAALAKAAGLYVAKVSAR